MRTKTLMFLITYRCNLRCSYCYEPKSSANKIETEHLKKLIKEKVQSLPDIFDSFELHFMGGEPLLEFPVIKEVAEWVWTQNFDRKLMMIYAPTNGTLLNEEIKAWCHSNRERFCLGLSFDGDESMQNMNRSSSASSVDLDFFLNTWNVQSVKMTVSPATISNLYNGALYLHKKGFKRIEADMARGKNIEWTEQHLKTLSHQLELLSDFYVKKPEMYHFSMLEMDIFALKENDKNKTKICSCGENLTCVDIDGEEYACHLFSPVALPKEKAKMSQQIDFFDTESFRDEECDTCVLKNLCTQCYGMNYLLTGRVDKSDPVNCAAFKIMYLANIKHRYKIAKINNDEYMIERINYLFNLHTYEK